MTEKKRKKKKGKAPARPAKVIVEATKPPVEAEKPKPTPEKKPHGAPLGNNNREILKTPEARQAAFQAYCVHRAAGYSDASFHTPVTFRVIDDMLKRHPKEFDFNALARAQAMGVHEWEKIGKDGTMGKIKGFNALAWRLNVFNRLGWKERTEHGLDAPTRKVFTLSMGKKLGAPADEDEG